MLENVDNLITHNKGKTFDTIIRTLADEMNYKVIGVQSENGKIKYNAKIFVKNSRKFDVPQNRPHVYIMRFDWEFWGDEADNLPNTLPEKLTKKIYDDLNDLLATGGSRKERNLVIDMREEIVGMKLQLRKTPLNDKGIRVMTPREWVKL